MKIYSPVHIKNLLKSIEENLSEEQQEIVKEMVSNYNKLFILAKELKQRESTFIKESNENDELKLENKQLKESCKLLKNQNRVQREMLKEYQNEKGEKDE